MTQPGGRRNRMRALRSSISVLSAITCASAFIVVSVPAQAVDQLAIASVEVGSPAKTTGVVKAQVNVAAPAGARVTFSVAKPARGSASITSTGTLTYTPTAQARHRAAKDGAKASDRTDAVRVTVTDATGQRASKKVRVQILEANQVPVIANVVVGQPDAKTGVVKGRITVTDPDGDPLTFQVTSDISSASSAKRSITIHDLRPRLLRAADDNSTTIVCPSSQGSLSLNSTTGQYTYTPTAPDPSTGVVTGGLTDTFNVSVSDGYGGTTSVPVSVPTGT